MRFRVAAVLAVTVVALNGVAKASAFGDELIEATAEAERRCAVIDAVTLESCGNTLGRSAAHSAARKAMKEAYDALTRFLQKCHDRPSDGRARLPCLDEADVYIGAGIVKGQE